MPLVVTLSSVGNPDFGQSPDASLPGVPKARKRVADLPEASKACLGYIAEHNLGGGSWSGGDVHDERGTLVGKVSYNGRVWPPGGYTLNGTPIYDPHATVEEPVDHFAFEEAEIEIPGYGKLQVTGCYRTGTIKSVPGEFKLDGRVVEFIANAEHGRDGSVRLPLGLKLLLNGNFNVSIKAPNALLAAVLKELKQWGASPEGRLLVARNERIDQLRERDHLKRNIEHHAEELRKLHSRATQADIVIEDLEFLIEQIAADTSPGRSP